MSGVFYGWWIVLAVSLIHFWGAGTAFYSFTAFFNPMVAEFNWSYAGTSLAMSFRSMETGIAAPIVGTLTDRFGPRRLVFFGSILAGLGFILLSRVNSLSGFYFYFILLSIGTSFCFTVPGYTAVANWFDKKRGIALGLSLAAIGFSGALIPAMNWVIGLHGWRDAMVVAGVGMWVVGIPASLALRHRPEDYGYVVDGIGGGRQSGSAPRVPAAEAGRSLGLGTREAMKTGVFWLIAIGATVASAGISAVSVHIMPALISVGIARSAAASLSAMVIVSSAAGRLGFGWLSDRISKKYLFGVALMMEGAGLLLFADTHTVRQVMVFALLFGPG
ncbi:MAG: MFS transporter, partial [Dehalococcoidia bacterium]